MIKKTALRMLGSVSDMILDVGGNYCFFLLSIIFERLAVLDKVMYSRLVKVIYMLFYKTKPVGS